MSGTSPLVTTGAPPARAPPAPIPAFILRDIIQQHPLLYQAYPHYHDYLNWIIHCVALGYTTRETIEEIERTHISTLDSTTPGSLSLLTPDHDYLLHLLHGNDGSEEHLRIIRDWCRSHAHSIKAIVASFLLFLQQSKDKAFPITLYTIYALDDIIVGHKHVTIRGPYTQILEEHNVRPLNVISAIWPYLVFIVHTAASNAPSAEDKDKLFAVVEDWDAEGLLETAQVDTLLNIMKVDKMRLPFPPMNCFVAACPVVMPATNSAVVDIKEMLECLSVGSMADLARAGLAIGQPKYTPLNVQLLRGPSSALPAEEIERQVAELAVVLRQFNQ